MIFFKKFQLLHPFNTQDRNLKGQPAFGGTSKYLCHFSIVSPNFSYPDIFDIPSYKKIRHFGFLFGIEDAFQSDAFVLLVNFNLLSKLWRKEFWVGNFRQDNCFRRRSTRKKAKPKDSLLYFNGFNEILCFLFVKTDLNERINEILCRFREIW